MRRLLEADYNRLVVKIVPWLLLGLVYVVMAVTLSTEIDTSLDRDYFFIQTVAESYANISTIIGFTVLFGVYGDEFGGQCKDLDQVGCQPGGGYRA